MLQDNAGMGLELSSRTREQELGFGVGKLAELVDQGLGHC